MDMEDFLERIRAIRPYLLASTEPPEKERLQSPEQQKKVDEVIRCILCACCTGSCPVMFENGKYVGPAALVWAFRYIFESRDEQRPERLRQVDTAGRRLVVCQPFRMHPRLPEADSHHQIHQHPQAGTGKIALESGCMSCKVSALPQV